MALYILGHSIDTADTAPLPAGATAHFYAEPGEPLHAVDVLAVLAGRLPPARTVTGPEDIKNYTVSADRSAELAREVSYSANPGIKQTGRVMIVGRDFYPETRLCTDPSTCSGSAKHTCSGLLSNLEPNGTVHFVFCRGERTFIGRKSEEKQARSQEFLTETKKLWEKIGALSWDEQKAMWSTLDQNRQIELLTVNDEAEDFVACLHIESNANGGALAAYRSHLASQRVRGEYVASIYFPPENPVKLLVQAGEKLAKALNSDALNWLGETGDRDSSAAILAGPWQELSLSEQANLLAIDDYADMRGNLPTGPIRRWLNEWYAISPTAREWFDDWSVPRPSDEWLAKLDRHNAKQLDALLDDHPGAEKEIEYIQHESYLLILGDDPSWFPLEAWIRSQAAEWPPAEEEASFTATKTTASDSGSTFSVARADDALLRKAISHWIETILESRLEWK